MNLPLTEKFSSIIKTVMWHYSLEDGSRRQGSAVVLPAGSAAGM
jgi:hypothetical protein